MEHPQSTTKTNQEPEVDLHEGARAPHNDNADPHREADLAQLSVIVFDLHQSQALMACAEMAKGLKEVAEGLKVAEEVGMRLLFVAMNRRERIVTCVPVANEHTIPTALDALAGAIDASEHSVAWVMLPEELGPTLMPHLMELQRRWETSTQGIIA